MMVMDTPRHQLSQRRKLSPNQRLNAMAVVAVAAEAVAEEVVVKVPELVLKPHLPRLRVTMRSDLSSSQESHAITIRIN